MVKPLPDFIKIILTGLKIMLLKNFKKDKVLLSACTATLLLLFYWVWLFYMTQPATQANTIVESQKIIDVEISLSTHRGTDKLFVLSQERWYFLDTGWQDSSKTHALARDILSHSEESTLTVWKHVPKSLFHIRENGIQVYEIADIRNGDNIIWEIENHNDFQKSERIFGILGGVFLTVVVIFWDYIAILGSKKIKIRKRKKNKRYKVT